LKEGVYKEGILFTLERDVLINPEKIDLICLSMKEGVVFAHKGSCSVFP
jgi:hypothetical protein